MTAALLMLAAGANFAPEHLAHYFGGKQSAWESVMFGFEAAALWVVGFVLSTGIAWRAVCAWGAFEALQRPVCRLAFPMDRAPPQLAPGQNLCDVAYQIPMSWVSVIAALFVACLLQEARHERR